MKYVVWWILLLLLVWWWFFYVNQKPIPNNGTTLASDEFQSLSKNNDYILIDIRNERELEETWVIKWLDKHKNVYNLEHVADLENMDKDGKYLFYCAHGNRSRMLREHLMTLWFTNVYDLEWWEAKRTEDWFSLEWWK